MTTLDVISNGRALLGLGAAWNEAETIHDRLPEERRAMLQVGTPEQRAEMLRPYIDAGFSGFTFNNPTLPTPESLAVAVELIKLLR